MFTDKSDCIFLVLLSLKWTDKFCLFLILDYEEADVYWVEVLLSMGSVTLATFDHGQNLKHKWLRKKMNYHLERLFLLFH